MSFTLLFKARDTTQEWKLLYRYNGDFQMRDFLDNCLGKTNTFLIFKSANGYISGGYTEEPWIDCAPGFSPHKDNINSFMFILFSNRSNHRRYVSKKCAVPRVDTNGHIYFGNWEFMVRNNQIHHHKSENISESDCVNALKFEIFQLESPLIDNYELARRQIFSIYGYSERS